jgi:hypothetical protein
VRHVTGRRGQTHDARATAYVQNAGRPDTRRSA